MKSCFFGLLLLSLFILLTNNINAQNYSILSESDTLSLYSKVFESNRKLILTKSKSISDRDINCIIYLDAHWSNVNGMILQTADNLIITKEIPESILVGIIPENRDEELTSKDYLLKFIIDEVIPYLSKEFNISPKATIAGYSLGGYFATYSFLQYNSIFNSCIAISPAYWPNNCDVIELIRQKNENDSICGNLYIAIGNRRWVDISIRDFVFEAKEVIEENEKIRFRFNDLDGFSHNSTVTIGFGLGLGFIYDDWEWINILEEQNEYLKNYPESWGHLEVKGDALFHLYKTNEAHDIYEKAIFYLLRDNELSKANRNNIQNRLEEKIKNCNSI